MSPKSDFGTTWWGKAWVAALEDRAQVDPERLARGRTYARHDHVLALVIDRGEVRAPVQGSREAPYRVTIRTRTFSDEEWERVLDAIVARAGHTAALLDGELDPGVDDDARSAGVELLPTAGELRPRCTCPDGAEPCKHAAAVCYLVANRLDHDPFELFALRGRTRTDVVAELRRRRQGNGLVAPAKPAGQDRAAPGSTSSGDTAENGDDVVAPPPDPGVAAAAAWRVTAAATAVAPAALRPRPGHPAPWAQDPPPDAPYTGDGLRHLATDAARRAWELAAGTGDGDLHHRAEHDLVRRAAGVLDTEDWNSFVDRTGARSDDLARRARAWRHGGSPGVDALAQPRWRPSPTVTDRGDDAVTAAGGGQARVTDNRVTSADGTIQLRVGPDERWYRFEKRRGRWELTGPPSEDPADLVGEDG